MYALAMENRCIVFPLINMMNQCNFYIAQVTLIVNYLDRFLRMNGGDSPPLDIYHKVSFMRINDNSIVEDA